MKPVIIIAIAFVLLIPQIVFADSHNISPISASTELSTYGNAANVIITGNIRDYDSSNGHGVSFLVISPTNDLVNIGTIVPNSDGSFQYNFISGGPLWQFNGDYIIEFHHGAYEGEITINYVGAGQVVSTPEPEPESTSEPDPEPTEPEPVCGTGTELVNGICQAIQTNELGIASFVDESKDPQSYVDRYNDEEIYKDWFDKTYPQYSSISEAVGLSEPRMTLEPTMDPEPTMTLESTMDPESQIVCGTGTEEVDGICQVILIEEEKSVEKSDKKSVNWFSSFFDWLGGLFK